MSVAYYSFISFNIYIHSFICLFASLLCQSFSCLYDCLMEHIHYCIKLFSLDIHVSIFLCIIFMLLIEMVDMIIMSGVLLSVQSVDVRFPALVWFLSG